MAYLSVHLRKGEIAGKVEPSHPNKASEAMCILTSGQLAKPSCRVTMRICRFQHLLTAQWLRNPNSHRIQQTLSGGANAAETLCARTP
jgi:hypothetical protein